MRKKNNATLRPPPLFIPQEKEKTSGLTTVPVPDVQQIIADIDDLLNEPSTITTRRDQLSKFCPLCGKYH